MLKFRESVSCLTVNEMFEILYLYKMTDGFSVVSVAIPRKSS